MVIPARIAYFDEPHARFAELARHQALTGETACRSILNAIGIQYVTRFVAKVQKFGNFALHRKGQFIRLNDSIQFLGRARQLCELMVQRLDIVELFALKFWSG